MKSHIKFTLGLVSILFSSCMTMTTSYFQVYKVVPSDKIINKDNTLLFIDENCVVSYNLWSEKGNIGFQFYNKTGKNIYIDLQESFFILNGTSYNYFKNRVFTSSKSAGITSSRGSTMSQSVTGNNNLSLLQTNRISSTNSVGILTSSEFSVSYNEEKIICIPSKTSKIITEYKINETPYRDCDLFKYPTKKQIKIKTFTKEQSPFTFSNRISYRVDKSDELIKFENEFYISEIGNYPESEFLEKKYDNYCGQESFNVLNYFKNASADKFYIKYEKGQYDDLRH